MPGISTLWRRARVSRAVSTLAGVMESAAGAVGTAAGAVGSGVKELAGRTLPGITGMVRSGTRRRLTQRTTTTLSPTASTDGTALPRRPASGGGAGALGAGSGRSQASPVVTTVVQDAAKCINLARCFAPCVRPPGTSGRRRVRFGGPRVASPAKAVCAKVAELATGAASPAKAAGSRPMYIQVRSALQLSFPTFEGAEHACYCVLLAGGVQRCATQAVPASPANNYSPVWNEVFTFPRACIEDATAASRGLVQLQVWSADSYGEELLVGVAELRLGQLLAAATAADQNPAAERPHPLAATLELQALDDDTGLVEPGKVGEVVVAAWVELSEADPRSPPVCGLAALPLGALDEAGVVTSNLAAPCGAKPLPAVLHSPLGTLYEEPCCVALKISVVALINMKHELLAAAVQGGATLRRVRLEGHRSCRLLGKGPSSGGAAPSRGNGTYDGPENGSTWSAPMSTAVSGPGGRPAGRWGATGLLSRLIRSATVSSLPHEVKYSAAPGPAAGGPRRGLALRWAMGLGKGGEGGRQGLRLRKQGSNVGAGGTQDDAMDEVDEAPAGGGSGGGALTLDEVDDGTSSGLGATAPLMAMTDMDVGSTAGAGGGCAPGSGSYCYFKVSVDKQSYKGRLRYIAMPALGTLVVGPDGEAPVAPVVPLQPSAFVFVLPRPLINAPVALTLYLTTSGRRRGRVAARVTTDLYDLLNAALADGSDGRHGVGLSGRRAPTDLDFEDRDLGKVRVEVQLADTDPRATIYRTPLVADPQQLEGADGLPGSAGAALEFVGGLADPDTGAPADGDGPAWYGALCRIGGALWRGMGAAPDSAGLLRTVLEAQGVEPEVEGLFAGACARAGSSRPAGMQQRRSCRSLLLNSAAVEATARATGSAQGAGSASLGLSRHGASEGPTLQRQRSSGHSAASAPAALEAGDTSGRGGGRPGGGGAPEGLGLRSLSAREQSGLGDYAGGSPGNAGTGAVPGLASRPAVPPAIARGRGGGPLGSALLRIQSLNAGGALGGTYCCVLKCGPHWLRTADRTAGDGAGALPQWQVVIPLYDPATVLTVAIFVSNSKSVIGLTWNDTQSLVSRVRLKLSTVSPLRKDWHTIPMYLNGGTSSAAPSASSAPGPLVGQLGLRLQYSGLGALLRSYIAPPRPGSLYELELVDEQDARLAEQQNRIAESWLASAQPPIPPAMVRPLLDDGRSAFDFARTKANWSRLKEGLGLVSALRAWSRRICSWRDPRDSWEVVFCIWLLCYFTGMAVKLFLAMLAMLGVRSYLAVAARATAAADNAAAASAASQPLLPAAAPGAVSGPPAAPPAAGGVPSAASGADGTARGGGAAVADATAMGAGSSAGNGGVSSGGPEGGGTWEDSEVALGTVAEYKRKFSGLMELGLMLQNLFDDAASLCERLQAVMSFQDAVASWLFVAACAACLLAIALAGLRTALLAALLWQVRPPALRDALPPPPLSWFTRLPCRSGCELG